MSDVAPLRDREEDGPGLRDASHSLALTFPGAIACSRPPVKSNETPVLPTSAIWKLLRGAGSEEGTWHNPCAVSRRAGSSIAVLNAGSGCSWQTGQRWDPREPLMLPSDPGAQEAGAGTPSVDCRRGGNSGASEKAVGHT